MEEREEWSSPAHVLFSLQYLVAREVRMRMWSRLPFENLRYEEENGECGDGLKRNRLDE
jgi:hypothetical protein